MDIKERLKQKGWTDQDINRALEIMYAKEQANSSVNQYTQSGSRILYWSALIVAIVGNILMSLVLIPFLISTQGFTLYMMISVIGLVFGFLITVLLRDIEHIDYKNHIVAGVFIPALAIINVYVMVSLSNKIANTISSTNTSFYQHNPIIISVVYVVAFMLPYFFYKILDMRKADVVKVKG